MRKFIYFILALASLLYLACIGYLGLTAAGHVPNVEIITDIALGGAMGGAKSFWGAIPLIIFAVFAITNFFEKNIKILFFIITILVIALDIIVLYFPSLLGA